MPKLQLTQQFIDNPPIVGNKPKTDYFDTRLTGFFLEVRASGKATYYFRYRDRHRRLRQVRISAADVMALEQAREAARQVKAGIDNGSDPGRQVQKRHEIPEFDAFVKDRYLPHVKLYKRSWDQDEKMIALHLSPIWGRARLSEISEQDIRTFLSALLSDGYKPGSVNRLMALVRYIFSLAEKWEVIEKSPVRGVSRVADNNRVDRAHQQVGKAAIHTVVKGGFGCSVPQEKQRQRICLFHSPGKGWKTWLHIAKMTSGHSKSF